MLATQHHGPFSDTRFFRINVTAESRRITIYQAHLISRYNYDVIYNDKYKYHLIVLGPHRVWSVAKVTK